MNQRRNSILVIAMLLSFVSFGQQTLEFDAFKQRVLEFHPIVRQATIRLKQGESEVRKARGQLDPVFYSEVAGKEFDDKDYYFLSNSGLKIPTWFGIDVKTGYEANRGIYLSEQNTVPNSGLWFAGVEVPLGQGLFFDERRAAIRQAQWIFKQNENEQWLILNDLLLDAYQSYWSWYEQYQRLQIASEGLEFAQVRFEGVRQNALLGDVPTIDTVEALIQLESRMQEMAQAQSDYQQAKWMLETYLWSDDWVPLELDSATIPGVFSVNMIDLSTRRFDQIQRDSLGNLPPLVLNSVYKIEQLRVEERWKREKLKPVVDLQYNALVQPYGQNQLNAFNPRNYKWGATVYFPLFLRKERGDLQLTKLKIESSELELEQKVREMRLKEQGFQIELQQLYEQLRIQQSQALNARRLRDAEQTRFEVGESSLFLVNTREVSYLSARTKLAGLEAKVKAMEAKWFWLGSELAPRM